MPFQNPFQPNLPDPWRCGACGSLIYNIVLDPEAQRFIPVPGAPLRSGLDMECGDICRTCVDMKSAIVGNEYMVILHEEYVRSRTSSKDKAKRLGRDMSDGNAPA